MRRDQSSHKDKALEMRRAAQILLDRAAELEAIAGSRGTHSEQNGETFTDVPLYQPWRDRRRQARRGQS